MIQDKDKYRLVPPRSSARNVLSFGVSTLKVARRGKPLPCFCTIRHAGNECGTASSGN